MPQRQINLVRVFFGLYAVAVFAAGLRLVTARPAFFAFVGGAAARTIVGPLLIVLGSAIAPLCLSRFLDVAFLRTALAWNLGGLVCLGIALNNGNYYMEQTASKAVFVVAFAAMVVLAGVSPVPSPVTFTTLFGGNRPPENLRSVYEEQIRAAAGQEERNRLARDLHDSIKQQIFAIQTSAAAAQARFDNDAAGAREALEGVRSSAREAMAEMEAMLDQLRASPLESVGLVEALRRQCEALRFRTGAEVQVDIGEIPAPEQLPPGAAQSILRIAQEAFANIARHARATEVQVSLCVEGDDCVLKIRDNGAGFNPDARGLAGMGLANMRARAAERGGKFELRSTAGEGTRVLATIPLTKPEDAEAADRLRQACGMAGAIILAVLLSVLAGIRFEGTALFMFFPIVLFVRYGYAADKAIRMGWVLTGLGVGAALPTFVVHNAFFINAMKGLAAGLLISASVQFFSRSRS